MLFPFPALRRLLGLIVISSGSLATWLSVNESIIAWQFRSGLELVRLDVSVTDESGNPVRGLGAADFTLFVDGVPRKIDSIAEVMTPAAEPAVGWQKEVAADVRRNDDLGEHRLFVIVMDDATLPADPRFLRRAKQIGRGIVDRLAPGDLCAVVFTRDNRHAQDFTGDRALLLKAIDTTSLGFAFGGSDDSYWWQASIGTLSRLAEYLREVPDRRKIVVHVSVGVDFDPEAAAAGNPQANRIRELLSDVLRQAQAANVTIYPTDPGGLGGLALSGARRSRLLEDFQRATRFTETLRTLADGTGGRAIVDANDFEGGLDRIFRENSSYYILGFQPAADAAPDRHHRVAVRVDRPGVQVRARTSYQTYRTGQNAILAGAENPLREALASLLPTMRGLSLRLSAVPLRAVPDNMTRVALTLGVSAPEQSWGRTAGLEVLVEAYTPEGRLRASTKTRADLANRGGSLYEGPLTLDLRAGRYQLRVAARAEDGRAGSVYYDLEIPSIRRGALRMSGIVLGYEVEQADAFGGLDATTRRSFAPVDRIVALVAVQPPTGSNTAPAITVSITDAAGTVVYQETARLEPLRGAEGALAATQLLPLQALVSETGPFLLTFEAAAGRDRIRRVVRFAVSPTEAR